MLRHRLLRWIIVRWILFLNWALAQSWVPFLWGRVDGRVRFWSPNFYNLLLAVAVNQNIDILFRLEVEVSTPHRGLLRLVKNFIQVQVWMIRALQNPKRPFFTLIPPKDDGPNLFFHLEFIKTQSLSIRNYRGFGCVQPLFMQMVIPWWLQSRRFQIHIFNINNLISFAVNLRVSILVELSHNLWSILDVKCVNFEFKFLLFLIFLEFNHLRAFFEVGWGNH